MDLRNVNLNEMNEEEVRSWLNAVGVGSAEYPPKPDGWKELYEHAWEVYEELLARDDGHEESVVVPWRLPPHRKRVESGPLDVALEQMNEEEVRAWLEAVGVSSAEYPPRPDGWGELYEYAWKVYDDLLAGRKAPKDA
jgi:hypothetical protein